MSWSDQFENPRGLRNVCREKISKEIFIPLKKEKEFKILVVDDFALKILSYSFKTEETQAYNIALFENLDDVREPLQYLSAAYLCFPSPENIALLVKDFSLSPSMYLNAHLFFLSHVPEESFGDIVKSLGAGFIKTFKEIYITFIPYESHVFSLNDEKFLPVFLDAYKEMDYRNCAFVAKKLATLCAGLNVFPRIRYRRENINNMLLAVALEKEMHFYDESYTPSHTYSNVRAEVLIIDRGFDCVTPLVYNYTFQAMAHDLLDIVDDVYEYKDDHSFTLANHNKISLTEEDPIWRKLRHEYFTDVAKIVDEMFEAHGLLRKYQNLSCYKSLPELGEAVKKKIAYRKNQPHGMYRRMANECTRLYSGGIKEVANIMQVLAFGAITENSFSENVRASVLNILGSSEYDLTVKLRLFLLYIFYAKGITMTEFYDIITCSKLPYEARVVTNILHLDVDIFRPGLCRAVDYIPRDDADTNTSPHMESKWLPAIKNVMLSCIDRSLSEDAYPYLEGDISVARTEKTGYRYADKKDDHVSRLIVFIAGGVTYSEMRCAYEVMSQHAGWEVYIGANSILTPKKFLDALGELHYFVLKDV